jgi:hypothetical protein
VVDQVERGSARLSLWATCNGVHLAHLPAFWLNYRL